MHEASEQITPKTMDTGTPSEPPKPKVLSVTERELVCDEVSKDWRSCRKKKVAWDFQKVKCVAYSFLDSMNERAIAYISMGLYSGSVSLVKWKPTCEKPIPKAKDIEEDMMWMRAICEQAREKGMSGYLIADALMLMDKLLNNNLYPKQGPKQMFHHKRSFHL